METATLKDKLDKISKSIPITEWKYFHKNSIENFINNIEFIKGISERHNTSEILDNYLTDVEMNFVPDIDYSIYLFNSYLKYIVPTYQNRLGFQAIPNRNVLILLIVVISGILVLLIKYLIWEVLFCFIILLITYSLLVKFKKHKVYGFRY